MGDVGHVAGRANTIIMIIPDRFLLIKLVNGIQYLLVITVSNR